MKKAIESIKTLMKIFESNEKNREALEVEKELKQAISLLENLGKLDKAGKDIWGFQINTTHRGEWRIIIYKQKHKKVLELYEYDYCKEVKGKTLAEALSSAVKELEGKK